MSLTGGFAVDCSTAGCSGGIANIYLANKQDIDTTVGTQGFTLAVDGTFSAVTMVAGPPAGVFYQFTPVRFTGEFREEGAAGENNCIYAYTQEIEFTLACTQDNDVRAVVAELQSQNCCGMVAIVEYTDGTYKAVGYLANQFLAMTTSSATSGKQLTDPNQVVITLSGQAIEPSRIFTGTVPV